uniref:Jnk1/mapk8 associated membrane protein n=1 Tax=Gasterosteus aculeatus aculeatus TaxID=481459 RepID=G3NB90_GASAC
MCVSAALSPPSCTTGSIWASWPCSPSCCTGSSSSGTPGRRVRAPCCSTSRPCWSVACRPRSPCWSWSRWESSVSSRVGSRCCRTGTPCCTTPVQTTSTHCTAPRRPSTHFKSGAPSHLLPCSGDTPLRSVAQQVERLAGGSYTIVLIYYAFCLVLMMMLRPLLVKKIACGLGKSDRFKSIYAALYFFPILTVLQAVGGGLLYYAFPYIILVLSLVTLAVYMSASEIQSFKNLTAKKKRLVVLFSHWLLHAYGIVSISRLDKLEQDLPLLALVPGPALFYIATAKFTEPNRILSEGGSGH